ncbi:unnamed protein product [Orchesella dallaii]|uniref:Uncharacterized protein n=1 Tax=Orchesella dallaii TaxID=48710 RepID=A0ABP1QK66_9HEXA
MEENFVVELCCSMEEQVKGFQQTCAQLLSRSEFVDCTLCCSDGQVQAHRIILASVSNYVYNLLSTTPWPTPCSHPMLFFKTSSMEDMNLALEFIYTGKVNVNKNKLPKLMSISHDLGCTSLTKAIEKAIQSCGVEIFRRRINQTQQSNSKSACSNTSLNQNKSKATNQSSLGEINFPVPSNNETVSNHPKINESNECNNGDAHLGQTEIKVEAEDDENSIQETSPSSLTTASKSILRSTLTPPPPLKRLMPPMTAAPVRSRAANPQQNNWDLTSENNFNYAENANNSNGSKNGRGNGSGSRMEQGDIVNEILEECMIPPLNGDEGDEDVSVDEISHIQTDENDDEEMPITVIDLKSLAEPEVQLSETLTKEDFMEMRPNEKSEVLPANCPWCFQVFTSITLLQRHIKTHVGNYKPYSCNYCPATFARSAHLKRHIRTHTGEKPFVCAICQKAFSRQDKLKTHLERHLQGQQQNGPPNSIKQPTAGPKVLSRNQRATNVITSGIMGQRTTAGYLMNKAGRSYPNNNNRLSKSLGLSENQIMISTASISPSTTITPILSESNPTFTFHQLGINNC